MKKLSRKTAGQPAPYPERILQFGGGNFLRGFVDWIVDVYNEQTGSELGVLVVKPTASGDYQDWRDQDGLYHVLTNGIRDDQLIEEVHLVKAVSRILHPYREWDDFLQSAENPELRYIISNTTESGIRFSADDQYQDDPPAEFPAKLTRWLYHRYQHFQGDSSAACIIFPTELITDNATQLRDLILQYARHWQLEAGFTDWILEHNTFCNTLVDRIIPGLKNEARQTAWQQIGFRDDRITQGEPYHLWAIEAPAWVRQEWPLDKSGLQVIFTDDLSPFRSRKIRILNGAHTAMVPVSYLYGLETVQQTVEHPLVGAYVQRLIAEQIIPSMDGPAEDLEEFAAAVLDRFRNPFIRHRLITISLNSVTKFRTRLLPTLQGYLQKKGKLPDLVVFALAALIRFYQGIRDNEAIPLNDDPAVIGFFQQLWQDYDGSPEAWHKLAETVLAWKDMWGSDLNELPGLTEKLTHYLQQILEKGMPRALEALMQT